MKEKRTSSGGSRSLYMSEMFASIWETRVTRPKEQSHSDSKEALPTGLSWVGGLTEGEFCEESEAY